MKKAKRGAEPPYTKAGHNGVHPQAGKHKFALNSKRKAGGAR